VSSQRISEGDRLPNPSLADSDGIDRFVIEYEYPLKTKWYKKELDTDNF